MSNLFPCHGAGGPSRIPLLLTGLLLCGALLPPADAAGAEVLLDWAAVQWEQGGPLEQHFLLSNGVRATITIERSPGTLGIFVDSGGGTPNSPLEDCPPTDCQSNAFGTAHDLAVVFNPNRTQPQPSVVVSPITIKMKFSDPVTELSRTITNLKFEISDIDFSKGDVPPLLTNHRLDQVRVTSNAGNPTLTPKSKVGPWTFTIDNNTATATAACNGGQPACTPSTDTTAAVPLPVDNQNPDAGTVIVDFGAAAVREVIVTYTEAGNADDPAGRGIGLFGELTPVELIDFTVD